MKHTELFTINDHDSCPKYRQLVNNVIEGIEKGLLKKGNKIPSLNQICQLNGMSRDTVMMAFNELKTRGLITSRPGKGYFILNTQIEINQRIFVLFDELNSFKEDMYNAFLESLDNNSDVDIYFHHFNFQVFNDLIENAAGNYTSYVIMPATFDHSAEVISKLPSDRVYILDREKKDLMNYPSIFQDFGNDVYEALKENHNIISKYQQLIMVHPGGKEPEERVEGLKRYCIFSGIGFKIIDKLEAQIEQASCYLVPSDRTLVKLIKIAEKNKLKLGRDIGIISFNDTVLKEVVAGGIATISTDFVKMGETLALMIKNKGKQSVRNPWMFIKRHSV